ncbi:MAG: hypothetical protein L0Y71_11020 [Gemmataceae bacterium]|nr:hypothetical protein [Gemmataceae bacterium]
MSRLSLAWIALFLSEATVASQPLPPGKLRYLRPAGAGWTNECLFTISKKGAGWSIDSVTERGSLKLSLLTRYRPDDVLEASILTVRNGAKESMAIAACLKEGVARVQLPEKPLKMVDVPRGVIVTSAPDWTDVLLLCARYDQAAGGKQAFGALWYHPEQGVQLLKLHIERQGHDTIRHGGKNIKLTRFAIHLRGNSAYAAWATPDGTLVRLIPLPAKEKQRSGLILESYEKTEAAGLAPAPR